MTGGPHPAGDHIPAQPTWRCEVPACGKPWPCPPAQTAIIAAVASGVTDLAGQTMYLSGQMIQAVTDLDGDELPDPHRRFLGWLATPVPKQPDRGTADARSVDQGARLR